MESLTCAEGHAWEREAKPGTKPRRCPEHNAAYYRRLRRESADRWAAANPEKIRERDRRRWRESPERRAYDRARKARHRAEHRDEVNARMRAWRATEKGREATRAAALARRARLAGVEVDPTLTWQRVAERDGMECAYCPTLCSAEDKVAVLAVDGITRWRCGDTYPTLDHVVPLAKGGPHTMGNALLACRKCNVEKNAAVI